MEQKRHSANISHARRLAAYLMLTVAVAWVPGKACAGSWTHDSSYGAVTTFALPGGQATLARDGADQQARTITHIPTSGTTTTITRDYGPSGHKAIEAENGTVRRHVYGAGLAPLLRVEGDGTLTYQVGMDTISVDPTGSTTVAHRMADIKQSTVAVRDTEGQLRQQVAYGTLGQSTSRQKNDGAHANGDSVYATAAQLANYEGLSLWKLGADQLFDNRARVYFPTAGRFLALDAAGEALGYEARGNSWIMFADYDGHMKSRLTALVTAAINDPSIVLAVGELHDEFDGLILLRTLLYLLDAENANYRIYSEENTLFNRKGKLNSRLEEIGVGQLMTELLRSGRLRQLSRTDKTPEVAIEEETEIFRQLKYQDPKSARQMMGYTFEIAESWSWDIRHLKWLAKNDNVITILYTGLWHLQKLTVNELYYQRRTDGKRYQHTILEDHYLSLLQPHNAFDLGYYYKLVSILPVLNSFGKSQFRNIQAPHWEEKESLEVKYWMDGQFQTTKNMEYVIFAPMNIIKKHPLLKSVFNAPVNAIDPDDEKADGGALPNAHSPHSNVRQGVARNHADHELEEEKKTEEN